MGAASLFLQLRGMTKTSVWEECMAMFRHSRLFEVGMAEDSLGSQLQGLSWPLGGR